STRPTSPAASSRRAARKAIPMGTARKHSARGARPVQALPPSAERSANVPREPYARRGLPHGPRDGGAALDLVRVAAGAVSLRRGHPRLGRLPAPLERAHARAGRAAAGFLARGARAPARVDVAGRAAAARDRARALARGAAPRPPRAL